MSETTSLLINLSKTSRVIVRSASSIFKAGVLNLGSKVISLLLLFMREPRLASAVLSFTNRLQKVIYSWYPFECFVLPNEHSGVGNMTAECFPKVVFDLYFA